MPRNILFLAIWAVLLFSSCNLEPDRATVIAKLRNSSKLATVEYVVSKIISAKDEHWFEQDAYFFAETQASIKVGIDLEKLSDQDIMIDKKRISITLPAVEVINFSYPAENFKVIKQYSENDAMLKWHAISVAQKDELYRQGEIDIRENIKNLGIMKTAQANAKMLITKMLQLSGFEEVYIQFKTGNDALLTESNELLENLHEQVKQQLK